MTSTESLVLFDRVRFAYGDYVAVNESSFTVQRGTVFGLLGTNGAGKTTTLELLQGFRSPVSGSVRVLGVDPVRDPGRVRRATGVMLQEAGFFLNVTVERTLRLWSGLVDRRDDVGDVLARVGLRDRADVPVQALSGGERRRLDVAVATWGSPELIVLDEPTTGLDPASRRLLWSHVRELRDQGSTVILTTHHLEEIEALADTIAIMDRGDVVRSGPLASILGSATASVTARVSEQHAGAFSASKPHWLQVDVAPPLRSDPDQRWTISLRMDRQRHQDAVGWLITMSSARGIALDLLRATPGTLEDVFLALQDESVARRVVEDAA